MKGFLNMHAAALVMAVLVGFLSIAPVVLATIELGSEYKGFPFLYLDDEDAYLARIQEVIDGHPGVGSAYFYEYKDAHALHAPIAEWLHALPTIAFGVPPVATLIFMKFFFPSLLFFLAYLLAMRLTSEQDRAGSKLAGLAAGALVTFGYELIPPAILPPILRGEFPLQVSVWTRPINPITGALMLFAYLLLTWELFKRRRVWIAVIAGVLLGLMVFYFFSWGVALSVSAFLGLFSLVRKDWTEVKLLAITFGASLLASAPYWYATLMSVGGEEGRALALRNGLFLRHVPMLNKTLLAAIVLFAAVTFLLVRREKNRAVMKREWWIFSAAMLLGGLWAFSQQILTGRTIWPYHFVQYTKPLALIVLPVMFFYLLKPWPRIWRSAAVVMIAVPIFYGIAAAFSYRAVLEDFRSRQAYAQTFAWLNANTKKDCVVLVKEGQEFLDLWIPAFTHCNVYRSSWVFTAVPEERILHNVLVGMRLEGVPTESAEAYLREHPEIIRSHFFEDWGQLFELRQEPWMEERIREVAQAYEAFSRENFADQLRKYKIDILLSDEPLSVGARESLFLSNEPIQAGPVFVYPF